MCNSPRTHSVFIIRNYQLRCLGKWSLCSENLLFNGLTYRENTILFFYNWITFPKIWVITNALHNTPSNSQYLPQNPQKNKKIIVYKYMPFLLHVSAYNGLLHGGGCRSRKWIWIIILELCGYKATIHIF